jgi:uncharacterized membrane protein YoaK (UPF0700 family)
MTPDAEQEQTLVSLLILLTAGTGLVDAVCYISLGHVFTANMTGNLVLLDSWIEIRKQKYFNKQAVTSCRS